MLNTRIKLIWITDIYTKIFCFIQRFLMLNSSLSGSLVSLVLQSHNSLCQTPWCSRSSAAPNMQFRTPRRPWFYQVKIHNVKLLGVPNPAESGEAVSISLCRFSSRVVQVPTADSSSSGRLSNRETVSHVFQSSTVLGSKMTRTKQRS